jgi:hypothetical protein
LRLKATLRTLEKGAQPEQTLESFVDDVRTLLLLTDDTAWTAGALSRLMNDVQHDDDAAPADRRRAGRAFGGEDND